MEGEETEGRRWQRECRKKGRRREGGAVEEKVVRRWGGKVVGHGEVRIRRDGCPSHEGKRVQHGISRENPSAQLPRIEYSTVLLVAYTLDNHAIYTVSHVCHASI